MSRLCIGSLGMLTSSATADSHPSRRHRICWVWRAGRLANQLTHQMQVAWLTGCSNYSQSARRTWGHVSLAFRNIVDNEHRRTELQVALEDERAAWLEVFGTESHADLLLSENQSLISRLEYESGHDRPLLHQRTELLLGFVKDAIDSFNAIIAPSLNSEDLATFHLARLVDRGLHPVPAHDYMSSPNVEESDEEVTSDLWSSEDQARTQAAWLIPTLPVVLNDSASLEWIEEIYQRWDDHPLELPSLCGSVEGLVTETPISSLVETIEQTFLDAVHTTSSAEPNADDDEHEDSTSTTRTVLYLGISVEDGRLRRAGFRARDVSRQAQGLIELLARRRDHNTSLQEIRDSWQACGGTDSSSEIGTVYGEITRTRRVLRSIGINIQNERRIGYRLVERSTDDASD